MAESGLIVRRSVRHEIVLPVLVRVAPEHADEIRFAKGVTDPQGWITCDLVDFATGGCGFVTPCYFPRGSILEVRLTLPGDTSPALDTRARVMRVQMTDRRPAYLVGVAFVETEEQVQNQIDAILDRIEGMSA